MGNYLDEIVNKVANTDLKDLDGSLTEHTCLVLIDTMAAIIAGGTRAKEVEKLLGLIGSVPGQDTIKSAYSEHHFCFTWIRFIRSLPPSSCGFVEYMLPFNLSGSWWIEGGGAYE